MVANLQFAATASLQMERELNILYVNATPTGSSQSLFVNICEV